MKNQFQSLSKVSITLMATFFLTLSAISQSFTRIDTSILCTVGGYSVGGYFGDVNNDGLDDLIIVNGSQVEGNISHFLLINEDNLLFSRVTQGAVSEHISPYGSHGAGWADYNNDGHLDFFIGNIQNENNPLFRNNGDGSFTIIQDGILVNDKGDSGPVSCVDVDNDGYIDLYVINQTIQKNSLYLNTGGEEFIKITEVEIVSALSTLDLGSSWSDIDNDGDLDVYMFGMDWGGAAGFQRLMLNDGDGNFSIANESGLTGLNNIFSCVAWGDYDNDGFQDLFIPAFALEWEQDNNQLYHNEGDGTFSLVSGTPPIDEQRFTDAAYWADMDNDGFLDLILTDKLYSDNNALFRNNGDGTFTQQPAESFESQIGGDISFTDINRDGFLDMFVARGYRHGQSGIPQPPSENLLFINNGNSNAWIQIKPVGTVSNKSAIGTRIKAKATINGSPVWQLRETGLNGTVLNAHFGLGDATVIDSLVVQWPAGHDTSLLNLDVNQIITITEEIPEGYLKASFVADTTIGRGELAVQFKDISQTDPGNPVTSWWWDFDGDGEMDSDEQHPQDTLRSPDGKTFDVKLVVSNGIAKDSITRKEYIIIHPLMAENLAQWGKVTASSVANPLNIENNVRDGEILSRWESNWTDNEWLKIEMDSVYNIGKVVIQWEGAFGKGYNLLTSSDDTNWDTIYCTESGDGGEDAIQFTGVDAKYVQLAGFDRGTVYGYSIYEFEIYRSDGIEYDKITCSEPIAIRERISEKHHVSLYPVPTKDNLTIEFSTHPIANTIVELMDISGKIVYKSTLEDSDLTYTIDLQLFRKGLYFIRISNEKYTFTEKMIKVE